MFRFVLGIHCHQPVGNFGEVIDGAVRDAYWPMLKALDDRPGLRAVVHLSGCLLQMLEQRAPDLMEMVRRLARSGRIELLGGAWYEPIFPVIPESDLVGQVEFMAREVEKLGGRRPRGAWLTERVWEPQLAEPLARAGVEYLAVDDEHFRRAGLRSEELSNRWISMDRGRSVALFPIDETMRYLVPFRPVHEAIDALKRRAESDPDGVVVLADDGEKFGVWPGTKQSCWAEGWVERFFDALEEESDWLVTTTFEEVVDSTEPAGVGSIPAASYFEMGEWALPAAASREFSSLVEELESREDWAEIRRFVRGGNWRGFLAKYPETRHRLARVRDLSARVTPWQIGDDDEVPAERESLWRATCNCAWWHGIFGGIYLPHLRAALSSALIRAEHRFDRASGEMTRGVRLRLLDLDCDGRQEACLKNSRLALWFRSDEGGLIEEFDDRLRLIDYADVLSRRPEAYHRPEEPGYDLAEPLETEVRPAEAVPPDDASEDPAAVVTDRIVTIHDRDNTTRAPAYDPFRRRPLRCRLVAGHGPGDLLTRVRDDDPLPLVTAPVAFEKSGDSGLKLSSTALDGSWRLVREVRLRPEGLDVRVLLEAESPADDSDQVLVLEWPIALWEKEAEIVIGEGRSLPVGDVASVGGVRELRVTNNGNGASLRFGFHQPVRLSHEPVRTVSLSEDGEDEIYQGALFAFGIPRRSETVELEFSIDVA